LLSIFRTNQFFANAFLVLYVILLWSPAFIVGSEPLLSNGTFLFDALQSILPVPDSTANYAVAAVLTLLQAVLINVIVSHQRLTEEITLFPGLFYILFMGFSAQFWAVTPLLIANFFLLFAIMELTATYKEFSSADRIFNIGLFIGIASLFYFSYIVFLLFAWIGIGILRAIRWKERVILILGFLVPYFFLFTYHFWYGMQENLLVNHISSISSFLDFTGDSDISDFITISLIGVLTLVVLLSYKRYTYKKKIKIQKIIDILFWAMAASALSLLIQGQINIQHFQMLLPILAIFVSINFVHMSKQWSEIWHFFLLVGVLIWHYLAFLNV